MSNKYPGGIITSGANAGYSVAFDGSGDYLTVTNSASSQFAFGTGDFTIEFWVYFNAVGTAQTIYSSQASGSYTTSPDIYLNNTVMYVQVSSSNPIGGTRTISANTWYHVALSRASGSTKLFVNGTQDGSTYSDTNSYVSSTNRPLIGIYGFNVSSNPLNGYVSNIRVVKGTALYTAAFTPPTQLLNITNTSLLTCNSPAIVDQSTNAFAITANGNAAVSTFTPFQGYVAYNPALGAATPGVWTVSDALQAAATRRWNMYDPYFNLTTLYLPGNGTNGAQNNTFLDSSTNNFTITRNGNTTQGTFSPFSQTGWSNYFDGTGDYLTWTGSTVGANTFVAECWFYLTSTAFAASYGLFGANTTNGFNLRIVSATAIGIDYLGTFTQSFTVPTLTVGTWYHVAAVRNASNQTAVFLNGVRSSTGSVSLTSSFSGTTQSIGLIDGSTAYGPIFGYISNARLIIGGTPIYDPTQSTITVPTAPLTAVANTAILTCQDTRFKDNSTNNFTLTRNGDVSVQAFSPFLTNNAYSAATNGGSGYFDGSGDYLTVPSNASWLFNGDACLEAWVYRTADTDGVIFATGGASSADQFAIFVTEGLWWGVTSQTGLPKPKINTWAHCVVTRSGSTIRRFIDGVLVSTGTNASAIGTSSGTAYIGSRSGSSVYFNGYMAGLRVINGSIPTSYQTSSTTTNTQIFTPPTAPPTTTSQGATSGDVKLLANFTNAGITDATAKNDLETGGNAQISTAQSKWGGSSLAFDGTGDYLNGYASGQGFYPGTSYTIEMWLRLNSVTGTQTLVCFGINNATNQGFNMYMNGTAVQADDGNTGGTGPSGGTLAINTWYHIAIVANGSNTRLFIDGVLTNTYGAVTAYGAVWPYVTIGIAGSNKSTGTLNGYIDDFRFSRFARYTANFTPPTSALQTQ